MKNEESQRSLCTHSLKSVRNESNGIISPDPLAANSATDQQNRRRGLMTTEESQRSLHSLPRKPERIGSDCSTNMAPATHYILEGKRNRSRRDLMKKDESQSSLHSLPRKPVRHDSDEIGNMDLATFSIPEGKRERNRSNLMQKEESQASLHSLPRRPVVRI